LSIGTVSGQENADLTQLQALLQLPGAQELLANLNKQQESAEAPVEPAVPVSTEAAVPIAPVETPVATSVDEPVESAHEQSPISIEPAAPVPDVDTDEDVHIVPGQVAASTPGETVVTVPTAEPVLEPSALSSVNQTIQLNATVTPDLVTVDVNQSEQANVTVTESVVNATTTNAPVVVSQMNPLQPVAELDERLEDEDEPESTPPVVEEAQPVEPSTEAAEEASAPSADASAVFNNLSAADQAALLAKLQAATHPDIDLKMANTDIVTGQVAAAEPALLASTAAVPLVNATEAPVETQTEETIEKPDSPVDAFGSRAEEPEMMMTGTNPQVYGGETEEATLVTEKPLFTDDGVADDDDHMEDGEVDEPDMEENVELDVDESDPLNEEINEDSFDPYDDYDEDDDWEEEYEDDYGEGEFEDEDDGWTQWDDDDDEDDLYEIDQDDDDNLDDEPRNHYDAAYREKLEDYENILEEQEAVFENEQEAEAAQYNFAFFMILFITVFTGGYYAYGKLREKFFPQSSSQQYTPLPKEDGDVKQSVSSEAKADEDWDNENW